VKNEHGERKGNLLVILDEVPDAMRQLVAQCPLGMKDGQILMISSGGAEDACEKFNITRCLDVGLLGNEPALAEILSKEINSTELQSAKRVLRMLDNHTKAIVPIAEYMTKHQLSSRELENQVSYGSPISTVLSTLEVLVIRVRQYPCNGNTSDPWMAATSKDCGPF